MGDLHEHWETGKESKDAYDAEESKEIQVSIEPEKEVASHTTISRKPAAIVGILLVTLLGGTFFYGTDVLRGQLATAEQTVTITATGPDPRNLAVRHGESIRFINRTADVHVLSSQTLCTDHLTPSTCMRTESMFPGESTVYTVPDTAIITTHTVISDSADFGLPPFQITVLGDAGNPVGSTVDHSGASHNPLDVGNILDGLSEGDLEAQGNLGTEPAGFVVQKQQITQELASGLRSANIPTNPYTVAGVRRAPTGGPHSSAPLPPPQFGVPPPTPQPFAQPTTGAETVALTLVLAIAGIAAVSWRVFRAS